MDAMQKITDRLETRSEELAKEKENGKKIVGIIGPLVSHDTCRARGGERGCQFDYANS